MGFLKYKGYTGSVEYSEEDNSIKAFIKNAVAKALGMIL